MSGEDPALLNITADDKFVEFIKFVKKFDREYKSMEEFQLRYKIFLESLQKIEELNNAPNQTATFGVTHFADQTEHEKKRCMGLARKPPAEQQ